MRPSAVAIHSQITLLPAYADLALSTAAAAVQKMGIAAIRRNCGATRLVSSNLTNQAFARSRGKPDGIGSAGPGKPFRKRISGSFSI